MTSNSAILPLTLTSIKYPDIIQVCAWRSCVVGSYKGIHFNEKSGILG